MYMTIAFLAAGKGTRFSKTGEYDQPKILISLSEKLPMVSVAYVNLMRSLSNHGKEHDIFHSVIAITDILEDKYPDVKELILKTVAPRNPQFHVQKGYVSGPARTLEELRFTIPETDHLLVANVDQLVRGNLLQEIKKCIDGDYEGVLFCFESDEDRYSYVTVDENNFALSMIEKEVVSNFASSGLVFVKEAKTLYSHIDDAIFSRELGDETYISDVCNEAIKNGAKFKVVMLDKFVDMGTPEDLEKLGDQWKLFM